MRIGGDARAVLDRSPTPRTVVASPGLPDGHPLLDAARARGLTVLDEAEVGWRLDARPWIAVTGTNGKSTTVRLIAALLRASGVEPVLGGNTYGAPPLTGLADGGDVVVAEISSYQLERSEQLLPELAVLTGIGHDHLDRHGTPERYAAIKRRLLLRDGACAPRAAVSVDDRFGVEIAAELRDRGGAVRTFGLAVRGRRARHAVGLGPRVRPDRGSRRRGRAPPRDPPAGAAQRRQRRRGAGRRRPARPRLRRGRHGAGRDARPGRALHAGRRRRAVRRAGRLRQEPVRLRDGDGDGTRGGRAARRPGDRRALRLAGRRPRRPGGEGPRRRDRGRRRRRDDRALGGRRAARAAGRARPRRGGLRPRWRSSRDAARR